VRQAARYNIPPREFANQIVQAGNLPVLMADVRRNKALATLLESANVTDASGNKVDLEALAPEAMAEIVDGDELEDGGGVDSDDGSDKD